MAGRPEEASEWLQRAAERYRESIAGAPAGSWGRPIGAMKALVLAGDWDAAAGGGSLGPRARGRRSRVADRAVRRRARAPRPRPRPRGRRSCGHDPHPSGVPARRRRRARIHRRAGRRRLHVRDRGRPRIIREARRVPRGHPRRRHRARPAGARRATRLRRRAQLPASPREVGGCMKAVITIGSTDGSSRSRAFSTSSVISSIACSGVTRPVTCALRN